MIKNKDNKDPDYIDPDQSILINQSRLVITLLRIKFCLPKPLFKGQSAGYNPSQDKGLLTPNLYPCAMRVFFR
jgi:hypothetical protein